MRCSRCKNLFFLEKLAMPVSASTQGDAPVSTFDNRNIDCIQSPENGRNAEGTVQAPDLESIRTSEMEELPFEQSGRDSDDLSLGGVMGDEKPEHAGMNDQDLQEKDEMMDSEGGEKRKRAMGKPLIYLMIILLLGIVYLWFFTETGNQIHSLTSSAVWTLVDKVRGTANIRVEEVGPAQVDLSDIRQRLIAHGALGIIRVVEGTAINQSIYPMTRIRVKGELVGERNVSLGVRESYCGNILTDDELASLTDEQIQQELSNAQGSDVSNDRIATKGRIPFMIVFTNEPPGVMKAFVTPAGAERLLP